MRFLLLCTAEQLAEAWGLTENVHKSWGVDFGVTVAVTTTGA